MTTEAAARYRMQTELLTAAKRGERDVSPELAREIGALADRYADATAKAEELRRTSERWREAQSIASDAFRGIFSDLKAGTSAADAFANALNRVADRLANMAIDDVTGLLFKGLRGGFGGGGAFYGGFGLNDVTLPSSFALQFHRAAWSDSTASAATCTRLISKMRAATTTGCGRTKSRRFSRKASGF
jgi:hypothetical protein